MKAEWVTSRLCAPFIIRALQVIKCNRRGNANLPPYLRTSRCWSYMAVSSSFLVGRARITQLDLHLRPICLQRQLHRNWIAKFPHGFGIDVTTSACSETLFDGKLAEECLLGDEGLCMECEFHGAASAPKWRRISCLSTRLRKIIAPERIFNPNQ